MKIYTIGTNKKSAEVFFNTLKINKIKGVVDIRLNNNSQLNGFTKGKDLKFFLKKILGLNYIHLQILAPSKEILNKYKKKELTWEEYERDFFKLLETREVEKEINIKEFYNYCFLCSEESPQKCHRRLVLEYFSNIKNFEIIHL